MINNQIDPKRSDHLGALIGLIIGFLVSIFIGWIADEDEDEHDGDKENHEHA